ncbi:hypothetical protein ACFSKL_06860, partial [Belliella marina]
GIGTTSPSSKLDVKGGISVEGGNPIASVNGFRNSLQFISTGHSAIVFNPGETTELMFGFHTNGNFYWGTGQNAGNRYSMRLGKNGDLQVYGNMGIGISPSQNYKFQVNGTIRAKEVKLEAHNWPDYVFEKDYELMPLEAVDSFIGENGHLPGLKPAKVYEEEGVNMMELNQKLLEKVEELTLYVIEQREGLILQNDMLKVQKEKLESLEKKLEEILR